MFCSNCGHKIEAGERFCNGCGAPSGSGMAATKTGNSSRWLKIVGIVGAVVLVIVVLALPRGGPTHSSPEAVVSKFLEAYEKGDAQQIIELTDPQLLAETMRDYGVGMGEIRQGIQTSLDLAGREVGVVFSFRIEQTTRMNGRALTQVTIRVKYGDYWDEDTVMISSVQRDGRWYIGEWLW